MSVPFHGRAVKGWVLGPAADVPEGQLATVAKVRSPVRFFDQPMLDLLRWVCARYLAPLSTVIERSHPPRVVGEERSWTGRLRASSVTEGGSVEWFRPLPGAEASDCVRIVEGCLAAGRTALVLVPEAEPLPWTAESVLRRFGEDAVAFIGGHGRERYRTWLDVAAGRYRVVVGTRPAVFSPLAGIGLIWVSREVHPGHREDRSPYYHVRDVAIARARIEGAACVLASYSPSVETAVAVSERTVAIRRPPRSIERAAAPLVETVAPDAEDRSARLGALLRRARSSALIVSRRGYGVARVCKTCRAAATCSSCRGVIVVQGGAPSCRTCGAPGRCAACGGNVFGVERGGAEHIAGWARRLVPAGVSVSIAVRDGDFSGDAAGGAPDGGGLLVGTAAAVKETGPRGLDLVAILDPDRALARSDLHAGERALATWMEAAAWAGPKAAGGRVLVQTRRPGSPAIQALVRWEPLPFLLAEAGRRGEAGFPPNQPVFRIVGPEGPALTHALQALHPVTTLATSLPGRTLCLVTVRLEDLPRFRDEVLRLASEGLAVRVEAEPHL